MAPSRIWRALAATTAVALVALAPSTVRADGRHGGDHRGFGRGGYMESEYEKDHGNESSGHGQNGGTATLSDPIAQGLAGPLQMAVRGHTIYVAQDFAGVLTKITPTSRTDIASNPGGEIAGVDVRGNSVYYKTTNADPNTGETTDAALHVLRNGHSTELLNTFQFESQHNPDNVQSYGFESIPDDCAAQWPVDQAGPAQYSGIPDSHPYAVAAGPQEVYVADAAGNDILAVDRWGNPRVVALLPPQPLVITADTINALGLPACTLGLTYDFEPVPTDVEIGHDGMLYVTTLPGGPEDPSLGARGSVYRINPWNGDVHRIATGFAGATNLAIGRHGSIFVSELFGNQVSRVVNGGPQPVAQMTNPAALEYAHGRLYVGYDVFANGSIATIDWSHGDDQNDD